jgi:hypothetical protein
MPLMVTHESGIWNGCYIFVYSNYWYAFENKLLLLLYEPITFVRPFFGSSHDIRNFYDFDDYNIFTKLGI